MTKRSIKGATRKTDIKHVLPSKWHRAKDYLKGLLSDAGNMHWFIGGTLDGEKVEVEGDRGTSVWRGALVLSDLTGIRDQVFGSVAGSGPVPSVVTVPIRLREAVLGEDRIILHHGKFLPQERYVSKTVKAFGRGVTVYVLDGFKPADAGPLFVQRTTYLVDTFNRNNRELDKLARAVQKKAGNWKQNLPKGAHPTWKKHFPGPVTATA